MIRRPPRSPLFPYTPLSRSPNRRPSSRPASPSRRLQPPPVRPLVQRRQAPRSGSCARSLRSEEHTSELQSPCNLVCRLLLEKKKKKHTSSVHAAPQSSYSLH